MSLHHYQTWTTPYVMSCVASAPMFTRSSATAICTCKGGGEGQVNEVSEQEEDCGEEEHCVLVEVEDGGEEVEDDGEEVEDGGEEGMEDGEEVEEDEEVVEDNDLQTKKVALHFIDCIIQDQQKADANVVLSCLEAAMHAMRH